MDAAGEGEIHQIGGINARGDPIKRERDAIEDVVASPDYAGEDILYWDKTDPSKAPILNPHKKKSWGGNNS